MVQMIGLFSQYFEQIDQQCTYFKNTLVCIHSQSLYSFFTDTSDDMFFAGFTDRAEEGIYRNINTGQVLGESGFQPWFPGK